jgi:hypothetical protein
MNLETELEQWRGAWQSPEAVPADLRRRVERQSRFMRIMVAADILVTVVIGGGALALAVRTPRPDKLLLAAATWLFIAIAWAFRWAISRGLWSTPTMHTAAFIDSLIRHCRAKLAGTVFGAILFVCEIVFCLGWIYQHLAPRPPLAAWLFFSSVFMDLVWLGTVAFFAFLIWYRRRKHAELAWLLTLHDPR